MALITCPECNKEISDKANVCIHCGCPITKEEVEIEYCHSCKIFHQKQVPMELIDNDTKYKCPVCGTTVLIMGKSFFGTIPESPQPNIPKCPTCGSVNIKKISTTERVGSVAMFGLFSKKINKSFKCNDCGYTW